MRSTWLVVNFFAFAFASLLFFCCSLSSADNTPQQPNIIFILADDLGWNDVGFHGSTQVKTPNIDKLASQGVTLENYYTQPLCSPSRSALLSGRYPAHIGMQHYVITATEPWGLDPAQKILPQYLKELGYATHMIGKWHQGYFLRKYTPTYRGFDTYTGHYFNTDYWTHSSYASEIDLYGVDFHDNVGNNLDTSKPTDTFGVYLTDLFTQRAVQLIKNHNTPSQPFFLYLAHWATHGANAADPLQATSERLALFPPSVCSSIQRAKFLGMLKALDDGVGAVVQAVSDKGWADNTIIVFASDNGGPEGGFMNNYASNYPLRGGKDTLWEGGVHAPAFIWSKQLQNSQPAYKSMHMAHITDWLPTLVNRAGAAKQQTLQPDASNALDGFDLWPALSGGASTASPRTEILLQYDQVYGWGALRMGDWKLLVNEGQQSVRNQPNQHQPDGDANPTTTITCTPPISADPKYVCDGTKTTPCLFNIKTDPCEQSNLATDNPTQLATMQARFQQYVSQAVFPRNRPYDPCANPQLYQGNWINWLDYTGGEGYESQLPAFSAVADLLAYESTNIKAKACNRTVTPWKPGSLSSSSSAVDLRGKTGVVLSAVFLLVFVCWFQVAPSFYRR